MICCILFAVSTVVFFGLFIDGVANGEVARLTRPYDSNNLMYPNLSRRQCGIDDAVKDYPYIYITDLDEIKKTYCVKSCPTSTGTPDCYPT